MHFSYQVIVLYSGCHRIRLVNDNELISDMTPGERKWTDITLVNDHELILYMNTLVNDTELILCNESD